MVNIPIWTLWDIPYIWLIFYGFHVGKYTIPGFSVRDLFGVFIRDLFRGEKVTSIWGIKGSLGRSWYIDPMGHGLNYVD